MKLLKLLRITVNNVCWQPCWLKDRCFCICLRWKCAFDVTVKCSIVYVEHKSLCDDDHHMAKQHIAGLMQERYHSIANALVFLTPTHQYHDDVIKWKHFPRNWPFVRGIHRSPVNPPPVTRSFNVFFDLRLNKCLSKQSWGWWLETPSCSLWRHCNDNAFPDIWM